MPFRIETPANHRAVARAESIAAAYRRAGFPEAAAAPEYCIDEIGMDGFYTFTISVYVGKPGPERKPWQRKAPAASGVLTRIIRYWRNAE